MAVWKRGMKRSGVFSAAGMLAGCLMLAGCGGGDEAATSEASGMTPPSDAASGTESAAPAGEAAAEEAPAQEMAAADTASASSSGEEAPTDPDAAASSSGESFDSSSGGPGGMRVGGPPEGMASGMMGAMPGAMPGMPGASGASGAVASTRPENTAAWNLEQLKDAVRERDPRAIGAIQQKAAAGAGDPKVAALLTSLLIASNEKPKVQANTGAPGMNSGAARGSMSLKPGMFSSMPNSSAPPGGGVPSSGGSSAPPGGGVPSSAGSSAPPGGGVPSSAGGGIAPPAFNFPDQSSTRFSAQDSLSMMMIEAATGWQQPGVGAIASGFQPPGGSSEMPAGESSLDAPMQESSGMAPGFGAGSMPGFPGAGGNPAGNLADQALVSAITDALVQNKTTEAWQTLFGMVSGTVKTPLSLDENCRVVVNSMVRHIDSDPAQVGQVLQALIDGSAKLSGESRDACLRAVADVSAQALDELTGMTPGTAQSATATAPGFGSSMPGAGMGMAMGSAAGMQRNMPSGVGAGMAPGMSSASGLAESSGLSGVESPGMAPGMPSASGAPGVAFGGSEGLSSESLKAAAQIVWGKGCVDAVVAQLTSATDLASASASIQLAATIPDPRVRQALYNLFSRVHSTGAEVLTNAGLFASAHDPGMLVVLKSLPRQKAPKGDAPATMDSWTSAGQQMVLGLRDQLRGLSRAGGKMTATGDTFPVKLHKNAVSEYAGVMTIKLGEAAAPGSETKVYYSRSTFTPQKQNDQKDLIEHYESRAGGIGRPDQARGIFWIDGTKTTSNGLRRSMDVIVQAGGAGGGAPGGFGSGSESAFGAPGAGSGGPGGGSGYTVEIIVVESADPKAATGVTTQADSGREAK